VGRDFCWHVVISALEAALLRRRMFKRELGVSHLLEFDHKRHSPLRMRNGNGLPVYLSEMGSMYLKSPSGRRSTTRPAKLGLLIGIVEIDDGKCDTRIASCILRFE
jgi:hypothetical protein